MKLRVKLPSGLDSGGTSYAYPGVWEDGENVRFWRDNAQVIGGWEAYMANLLPGVCRNLLPWMDRSSLRNVAFGCHNALMVAVDSSLYDITPALFYSGLIDGLGGKGYGTGAYGTGAYSQPSTQEIFPQTWSLANWGESLMASPRGQLIFWWQNSTTTRALPLANAPARVSAMVVTPTRQVMALGCNEEVSGTFNPMAIRFSDIEKPTVWTTTSANNAGEVILEGGGMIVGAKLVGDDIFVWTTSALWMGRFTGNTIQPWAFTKVGEDCGLCGPNAAAVQGQTAYWLSGNGRFYACVLGGVPQMLVLGVGDDVVANLAPAQNDKIVAATVSAFNEVWWFYADARDGNEVSRYLSVQFPSGQCGKGTVARTAFVDGSAASLTYPLGVSFDGGIYYHEKGQTADGGTISGSLTSSYFYLNDAEDQMLVRGVWPDFRDQVGPVQLSLLTATYPQDEPKQFGPSVTDKTVGKIDFLTICRLMKIRLDFESAPAFWKLGALTFDVVPAGQR